MRNNELTFDMQNENERTLYKNGYFYPRIRNLDRQMKGDWNWTEMHGKKIHAMINQMISGETVRCVGVALFWFKIFMLGLE